jgi:tetratricopeptide (TPR) repeat protein
MAPEQAAGEIRKLDARTDVFGLGAMLCEIRTAAPPYLGRDENAVRLQAVRWETADAFARLDRCGAEPDLVALCKRCLAFKQEDRPAEGTAVAQQVAAIRHTAEARARHAELEQQRARVRDAEARKRRRGVQWAAAAITLVLLAGLGVSLWQMQRAIVAESVAKKNAADALRERDAKAAALKAEEQARRLADERRVDAETNLGYARKATEILGSVFTGLGPRAEYQTIAELRNALANNLKGAVEQLQGSAIGDPLAVADMRNTLGLSLNELGEQALAITVFERALATHSARLGPDHPDTLTSMNNLAMAYRAAGRLDEALPLFEQAATGMEKRAYRHEHAGGIIGTTVVAYEAAGQLARAEAWQRKWLAHVKDTAGADSLPYAGELAALGLNLLQLKKWAEAEAALRECLIIRQQHQPEAWTTFNTRSMHGEALLGQQQSAEAEPLLLSGYEGLKARQDDIPQAVRAQRLIEAVDRLIALYTAMNRPDDVQTWQAEKARLSATPPAE